MNHPLKDLPEYCTVEDLKTHIRIEDIVKRNMPMQFGGVVSEDDCKRIWRAYAHLRGWPPKEGEDVTVMTREPHPNQLLLPAVCDQVAETFNTYPVGPVTRMFAAAAAKLRLKK